MRALANLKASIVAIVTILALLIVPACGSLCAAMNQCSSTAPSADSDTCHHTNMSAQSDSETLSSLGSCSQPAPLMAILSASDSSVQIESVYNAHAPYSIQTPKKAFTPNSQLREFPVLRDSAQQSTPLESLSVLRI
jgi:hypothetical protein